MDAVADGKLLRTQTPKSDSWGMYMNNGCPCMEMVTVDAYYARLPHHNYEQRSYPGEAIFVDRQTKAFNTYTDGRERPPAGTTRIGTGLSATRMSKYPVCRVEMVNHLSLSLHF